MHFRDCIVLMVENATDQYFHGVVGTRLEPFWPDLRGDRYLRLPYTNID